MISGIPLANATSARMQHLFVHHFFSLFGRGLAGAISGVSVSFRAGIVRCVQLGNALSPWQLLRVPQKESQDSFTYINYKGFENDF